MKEANEKYVIKIIVKTKHLEPHMTEAEIINKLSHHFCRGIQIAVFMEGVRC